ncbi:MAG TPA: carbonic anhydrase, partial [Telluria sp.]
MSLTTSELLKRNEEWAQKQLNLDPDFFKNLSAQQSPEWLWIGCSDSRVPANELVGMAPGELFVHRNIANVVVHSDLNCLSVLQFAVDVLKVKHIVIVGHYGCGGVHAALTNRRIGLADNWLRHVQDVKHKHGRYLGEVVQPVAAHDRLVELNVAEQVI